MRANKNAQTAKYMNREPGSVIPAKAGIQYFFNVLWTLAYSRVTLG